MDQLPSGVLAVICNCLPWKDRLLVRRLSTKFRSLPCDRISVPILLLGQEKKNLFRLTVCHDEGQRSIAIIRESQSKAPFIRKTTYCKRRIPSTEIHCSHSLYLRFIQRYIDFFFSVFLVEKFFLIFINRRVLVIFRHTLRRRPYDWRKSGLYIWTQNNALTKEDIKLLTYYPAKVMLSTPLDFKLPHNLWELPAIVGAKAINVSIGRDLAGRTVLPTVNFGLKKIDDDFIGRMLREKKNLFFTNDQTSVSIGFLMDYIQNCLKGGHVMTVLGVHRSFDANTRRSLIDFLLNCGFEKSSREDTIWFTNVERRTKDGQNSFQLSVNLRVTDILIRTDISN